jgi:hypothetical protein
VSQGIRGAADDFGGSLRNYHAGLQIFDRYEQVNRNTAEAVRLSYEQTLRSPEYQHEAALQRQFNTVKTAVPQGLKSVADVTKWAIDFAPNLKEKVTQVADAYLNSPLAKSAGGTIQKDFGEFFKESMGVASDYHGTRAGALLKYNMAKAGHEESTNVQNYEIISEAVGLGFNSHDMVRQAPGSEALDVIKAAVSPNFSKAAATLNQMRSTRVPRFIAGVIDPKGK